jgi:hypothetical protein
MINLLPGSLYWRLALIQKSLSTIDQHPREINGKDKKI